MELETMSDDSTTYPANPIDATGPRPDYSGLDERQVAIKKIERASRDLAERSTAPSASLSTEQLLKIAHLVDILGAAVCVGGDEIDQLWEAYRWQPSIMEKRRTLVEMVEAAIDRFPNNRDLAGQLLGGNLSLFWPQLGLRDEHLQTIVAKVKAAHGNARGIKICVDLCEAILPLRHAMQHDPEDATGQGFKDATRGR